MEVCVVISTASCGVSDFCISFEIFWILSSGTFVVNFPVIRPARQHVRAVAFAQKSLALAIGKTPLVLQAQVDAFVDLARNRVMVAQIFGFLAQIDFQRLPGNSKIDRAVS